MEMQTNNRTRKVSIKAGTHSPTPSKKPPLRTISRIIREEDEQLYSRFPEMRETIDGITTLGPWLSSLIEDGDDSEDPEDPDYKDVAEQLLKKVLDQFDTFKEPDQRKLMGNQMAKNGVVKDMGDFYKYLVRIMPLAEFTLAEAEDKDDGIIVVEQLRQIFWNLSDNSVEFCAEIAENTEMIRFLVIDLLAIRKDEFDILKEDSFPFLSAVGILHNVARSGVTKTCFSVILDSQDEFAKPIQVLDVLMPYLETKNTHIKLITLLGLAHIVNEQQNQILSANASLFDFLLETLKSAIKSKDHRKYGFSVEELLDGLANLAKNDLNKAIIMDKKAFPILKDIIIKGKSQEEKAEALKVIWELSFMGKNKQTFMGDKEFWKKIYLLQSDSVEEVSKAAQGACFVITDGDLHGKAPQGVKSFRKPAPIVRKKEQQDEEQHIMISYNWADQKMLLRVRDRLQDVGYKVWMDVDNMEGDILDAMARAVENAHIVLMCYSEKYKESKNCRTEAQYAYQVNKDIIPVLMQTRYKPDGWLGILVGSKLFYEFTTKYPFENKIRELIRELENRFRVMMKKDSAPKVLSIVSTQIEQTKKEDMENKTAMVSWTTDDLSEWLSRNKLEAFVGLKSLSGAQLAFLYKLFRRAPEFFYRCLEEKLGLQSLEDLMRFTDALEKLSEEQPDLNQQLL
ncbi:uncharacterized protein LOC132552028 [Ylistrum balloti]|uniref:uncharacterized protein LOC132552028 n=1 Tax=Ylistrum balloti TaxID=509963 RepID=UPI002905EEDF|nr:uncharacterized protein LOC132552028 [Ylistrum balloti]